MPLLMEVQFKPSFNFLMKKTLSMLLYMDLKRAYSKDMKDFEQFGTVKAVLEAVQKSVSKENEELSNLIQRRLNGSDSKSLMGKSRSCEKLTNATRVWSLEPASTAYAKSIRTVYKDKTLDDWYNYMRLTE